LECEPVAKLIQSDVDRPIMGVRAMEEAGMEYQSLPAG